MDYGIVIEEGKSGICFSVEYLDYGSFYDFVECDSMNLFVVYCYMLNDVLMWDISVEYYDIDYLDNVGINCLM